MPDIQTQLDFLESTPVPDARRMEIAEILTDMANMNRTPDVLREFEAINELIEAGRTIPQISVAFDIPESIIVARLRVGNLDEGLQQLLQEGRMSVSLAQRLGAESPQTQQRIWNEHAARERMANGPLRLTASVAYPGRATDEQLPLPVPPNLSTLSAADILAGLTRDQRGEFTEAFLSTMRPDYASNFFSDIPTHTRRDLFRHVMQQTLISEEYLAVAEDTIPIEIKARWISRYISENTAEAFLSLLATESRNAIRDFYVEVERRERESLRAEITHLRHEYDVEAELNRARAALPIASETPGRAYRETLPGPSDDPSERSDQPATPSLDAVIAAQFDYPVAEESWELVVDHLTDAADAMPLSPSDECDRFHIDIETLRVRAIAQQRAENANAGVISGRVIPPPAPEPAPANAGRVRTRRAPQTLNEHARLLAEQAEQINANTTRRRTIAVPDGMRRNENGVLRAETATERRERLESIPPTRQQHLNTTPRPQQHVLESSRRVRVDAVREAAERATVEGDATIRILPDGTAQRVDALRETLDNATRPRRTRPRRPNI